MACIRVVANVLVLALVVYWVAAAGRQFQIALDNRPGGGPLLLFAVAILSLVVGVYTGCIARMMFRRSYRTQGRLVLVAVAAGTVMIPEFCLSVLSQETVPGLDWIADRSRRA